MGQTLSGSDDNVGSEDLTSFKAFTPRVTALHSVNAALAESGDTVYFLPSLEDFPVALKDTAADITDANGKSHKFAAVYDGYRYSSHSQNEASAFLNAKDKSTANRFIFFTQKIFYKRVK